MSDDIKWPSDRVERKNVAELIPYARNARTHSDEQVNQIAASIREWGFTNPVLIDDAGTIIAGHGRVMAAQRLGLSEVPVMVADGWTDAQKQAYILADNKLALNAGWDDELLKVELGDLERIDFDLSLIGFDGDELDRILDVVNFAPGSENDQGALDELDPKWCKCPNCGDEFDLRKHGEI